MTAALKTHNIFDEFQSGYRQNHSTETALLRVHNDILMASDSGKCTALVLLDLSSAFDTVDHAILLDRLQNIVGISGCALDWFSSYLSGRTFSVASGPFMSDVTPLSCGVPQGSVLGPVLFTLYTLPLGEIIRHFKGVSYHMYADDIQLYHSFDPDDSNSLTVLLDCLSAITAWLSSNSLQLNTSKTEVLIVTPSSYVDVVPKVSRCLGTLNSNIHPSIRNLGVIFDQNMYFDKHIQTLTRTCFFHLKNIAKLRSIVSHTELELILHAFVSSQLTIFCSQHIFSSTPSVSTERCRQVINQILKILSYHSHPGHPSLAAGAL